MLAHLVGLSHWQVCLLVTYLFVQGAFFTVFPEEVILPTLGVLWSQGHVGFFEAFMASILGLTGGDLILLFLGRNFGIKLLKRRPFSWIIDSETLSTALDQVHKHGSWMVFVVRFIPMVRAPTFFACGMTTMSVWRFLKNDWAGLGIWIPFLILVGRHIGGSGSIEQAFHKLGLIMALLVGSAIFFSILRNFKKRQRMKIHEAET
jgi:membrane protein DedA with SNARE-associated domain